MRVCGHCPRKGAKASSLRSDKRGSLQSSPGRGRGEKRVEKDPPLLINEEKGVRKNGRLLGRIKTLRGQDKVRI